MTLNSFLPGLCMVAVLALQGDERRGTSAGPDAGRAADLAAIEKLHQQTIAATVARDPAALADCWTDDAILIGGGQAEVGKQAIRASFDRQTANKDFKVLSYVPETKDLVFLEGGWAVEWRTFTGSFVASPGSDAKQARGTALVVLRKLPDGRWKGFRAMGAPDPPAPPKGDGR